MDVGADWRVAYSYLKGTVAISKGNRHAVLCNVKHAGGESVWDAELFAVGARGLAPRGLRTLRRSGQRSGAERDCCFAQFISLSMFKVVRCGSAGVEVQLGVIGPGALSAEEKASWTLIFSL